MVYISIYIQDISTCIKGDFHKKNKNDNELMKTTLLKWAERDRDEGERY